MRERHRFPDAGLVEWTPTAIAPVGHELCCSCPCGPWVYTDLEWGVKSIRHQSLPAFDIGTPSRCYLCGDIRPRQSFGDGGYVWACTTCPHPSGE